MCARSAHSNTHIATPSVLLLFTLAASVISKSSATEDVFSATIQPGTPLETVEAPPAPPSHRQATALNRFTFEGNVLKGTGDLVDHWIVMFCPAWHDKCQGLLPSYELLGIQWENKLNKEDIMRSHVRFAKVDCATEKALCVSLAIEDYPSVVHYHKQERVGSWTSGAPGLVRFVKQELEGPKPRAKGKRAGGQKLAQAKESSSCDAASSASEKSTVGKQGCSGMENASEESQCWFTLRQACFALMLLAAVRSVYVFVSSVCSGHAKQLEKQPSGFGQQLANPSSLQACLPQEWARDRSAIVL